MSIRRALVWVYPAVILAAGIGFLIWSFSQSGAADAYRKAPECGAGANSGCYELTSGQITSVQVNQTREGERDDVVIQTTSHGPLTATLEPSATEAPHVRTGADVTVKLYQGQVALVEVDGFAVASTANPVSNQGDTSSAAWLLIALGLISFGVPLYAGWRRKDADESRTLSGVPSSAAQVESEILPSGSLGWSVRPRRNVSSFARYGFGALLLLGMTYPALVDPARTQWAMLFDSVVILGMVALVALFLRNDLVFADRQKVGKTDLLGRTVTVPLNELSRAERFSVRTRYGRNQHLVFVGADGRKAFEVAGPNWDYERLGRLCGAAGIKVSGSYDDLVGAFKLNQRVPGTTKWGQQALMLFGLVVFIVAFVALLIGPSHR